MYVFIKVAQSVKMSYCSCPALRAKSLRVEQPNTRGYQSTNHDTASVLHHAKAPGRPENSIRQPARVDHSAECPSSTVGQAKNGRQNLVPQKPAAEGSLADPSAKNDRHLTSQERVMIMNTRNLNLLALCLPRKPRSLCAPEKNQSIFYTRNYTS